MRNSGNVRVFRIVNAGHEPCGKIVDLLSLFNNSQRYDVNKYAVGAQMHAKISNVMSCSPILSCASYVKEWKQDSLRGDRYCYSLSPLTNGFVPASHGSSILLFPIRFDARLTLLLYAKLHYISTQPPQRAVHKLNKQNGSLRAQGSRKKISKGSWHFQELKDRVGIAGTSSGFVDLLLLLLSLVMLIQKINMSYLLTYLFASNY